MELQNIELGTPTDLSESKIHAHFNSTHCLGCAITEGSSLCGFKVFPEDGVIVRLIFQVPTMCQVVARTIFPF